MSDFIRRLAGRELGESDAIQPRLPSVYEPPQRSSGPLWVSERQTRDATLPEEEGGLGDQNLETDRPRRFTGLGKSNRKPASAAINESQNESTRVPQSVTLASVGGQPVESQASAFHVSNSEPAASLASRIQPSTAVSVRRLQRVTAPAREGGSLKAKIPAASSDRARRDGAPGIERIPGQAAEAFPGLPRFSSDSIQSAGEDKSSTRFSAVARPAESELIAAAKDSTRRAPVRISSEELTVGSVDSANSMTTNRAAAEPTVRVSIGRVEVRAVFPPTPVRRAPVAKPKPGVSLEDYLKGRNRGAR